MAGSRETFFPHFLLASLGFSSPVLEVAASRRCEKFCTGDPVCLYTVELMFMCSKMVEIKANPEAHLKGIWWTKTSYLEADNTKVFCGDGEMRTFVF